MDPYRRLAFAVLEHAVCDALAGDPDARHFLAAPNVGLELWCQVLGVHPARVRRAAQDPRLPARLAKAKNQLAAERVMRASAPGAASEVPAPARSASADDASPGCAPRPLSPLPVESPRSP